MLPFTGKFDEDDKNSQLSEEISRETLTSMQKLGLHEYTYHSSHSQPVIFGQ